ncbi:unnamed protein product [Somion occarium]|uniref:Yeast cell wall synthesis Kre9/Knh1-like N-terminal domain-containing protein n=1 Tax=Somion occarium TaxID=3059160 RepID=A0ABP1DME8_9APHY
MKFSRAVLSATFAALIGVATADLKITTPSSNAWWVAQSINTIAWTCQESQFQTFTILIANTDPKVLTQPQAIIAIENNFDCSKTITQDQASQAAGSGYTILLANPLNSTEVYATSEPFEIKPLGSAYPTTSASTTPTATGSSASNAPTSGSDSQSTSGGSSSDATSLKTSIAGVAAIGFAALGYILA